MTAAHHEDLSSLLSRDVLLGALRARMPFQKDEPVDWSRFWADDSEKMHKYCLPALKKMSTMGVENIPDLMQYLPDPTASDFPELALGMLAILDQGPRSLFEDGDQRYIFDYFDHLALKVAQQLWALPDAQRPDKKERWLALGYSYEYWVLAVPWFLAPIVHSENLDNQKKQLGVVASLRADIEKETGLKDPNSGSRDAILKDPYAFSRLARQGPPSETPPKMPGIMFWMLSLFDAHFPVIDTYGRYPYRNDFVGRESTEEEKEFLEKTNHFAESSPEVAKKIKEDVDAGRWTPLQAS